MTILMEKAPEGLHAFCEELIAEKIEKSSNILDIATGTGAMSRRLLKRGYTHIVANDINADAFEASEVEFKSNDLNSDFVQKIGADAFDLILAVEIIEHLENPLSFVRQCTHILKKGGYLLITTPNVLGSESLIQWLKNGHWLYFSPEWYHATGHISILPAWLLDEHVIENGLRMVYRGFTPRLLKRESNFWLRNILGDVATRLLDIILRSIGKPKAEVQGTNYVVLCRK
ncbi:class I SAM-dependent methyltransferase [Thermodesulfobacteriota bacterium]